MPTREDAWKLLCEYTQSESLRKHMLAVEACVRAYARKHGADEKLGTTPALRHDFASEPWPTQPHPPDHTHQNRKHVNNLTCDRMPDAVARYPTSERGMPQGRRANSAYPVICEGSSKG